MPRRESAYNAACYLALAGQREGALAAWQRVADEGGIDVRWAQVDPDLDSIRDDPRFEEGMDRLRRALEGQTRI